MDTIVIRSDAELGRELGRGKNGVVHELDENTVYKKYNPMSPAQSQLKEVKLPLLHRADVWANITPEKKVVNENGIMTGNTMRKYQLNKEFPTAAHILASDCFTLDTKISVWHAIEGLIKPNHEHSIVSGDVIQLMFS